MTRASWIVVAIALAPAAACSQDVQPPPLRNLNRPTDIAFACFGDMRLPIDDTPDVCESDGECIRSAQPLESCERRLRGEIPIGQEAITSAPLLFAFVLQSGPGTVATVVASGGPKTVDDSDPLVPGKNSTPIGTLPVGVVADPLGCHMIAANAGSCDLSVLDVNSALDDHDASIARIAVTSASGAELLAKPRAIEGRPAAGEIGTRCPSAPDGLIYVAYPECHLVAAIDSRTGEVRAGIQFNDDGTQTITDGNVTCDPQCGTGLVTTGGGVDAGPEPDAGPLPPLEIGGRPVAMHVTRDGSRMFIASENMPLIVIADLDAAGMPTALSSIRLEGDIGVTSLNVTDSVDMGGELGQLGGTAGQFTFVYAVATDGTVRVADVGAGVECDTQVDPRFLHEVRDVSLLACLPVGGASTPPRRAGARGPGLEFLGVPTSVSFAQVEPPEGVDVGPSDPTALVGYFAFVTSSAGFVFVVNVDDDNYPDFEKVDDPARTYLPLALAHQVRDFGENRASVAGEGQCDFPAPDVLVNGPRMGVAPPAALVSDDIAGEQAHLLPAFRQLSCEAASSSGTFEVPVTELHFAAPIDTRELVFPDLRAVRNENWVFTWEGSLSIDAVTTNVDGPPVRNGFLRRSGTGVALVDGSAPFCATGVEPFDIVFMAGCDPSRGDAECGLGETCFVHPDSPATLTRGVCIPDETKDQVAAQCRDFLISAKQYTVLQTFADHLVLGERRRVLRTTPLDGCTDAEQCEEMFEVERRLADPAHPIEREPLPELPFEPTWACEADPSRAPGPNRCVMTCDSDAQCEGGFACSGGHCVAGELPPPACFGTVQRYQLRVGDAFAVVGERTGFLHDRILDTTTGACIDDPDKHPLLTGRLPLRPPACTGETLTDITPNPCSTTVSHIEQFVPFEAGGDICTAREPEFRTRQAPAVRFSNPVFTFHLVDTETTGDLECRADLAGELPAFSAVHPGFIFSMEIQGGFFPMFVNGLDAAFPVSSVEGPDGLIWVLDQGDANGSTRGQVFTLNPGEASNSFAFETIL